MSSQQKEDAKANLQAEIDDCKAKIEAKES